MNVSHDPPSPLSSDRPFADRYRLERQLRNEADRATYFATDLTEGGDVVVRTASFATAATVHARLMHEAAVLTPLRHPSLAPLVDFGRHDDVLYWVRPRVEGVALSSPSETPRPLEQALALGRSLFDALKALHDQRVLCRNLRPSNLIFPEGESSVSLVLTDFGLASSLASEADVQRRAVADVLYLSPEQAGSLDYDVGESSDLYSA